MKAKKPIACTLSLAIVVGDVRSVMALRGLQFVMAGLISGDSYG